MIKINSQRSNFSSKGVGKIIAEAEAKKKHFADVIESRYWQFPRLSSEVTSAMLFYLINHYKTIINCLVKSLNNSK